MTVPAAETSRPQKLRLFIAILLPDEIKAEVAAAQSTFRCAFPDSDISWTKREQWHLTLKFLGNVDADRVSSMKQAVEAACRSCAAVPLCAQSVGSFPEHGPPRVLWVGITDKTGRLAFLHESIENATQNFAQEERTARFIGHVTVGRVRKVRRVESDALKKMAAEMAGKVFGQWSARDIEMMRSDLTPDGARHESIARIPLGE